MMFWNKIFSIITLFEGVASGSAIEIILLQVDAIGFDVLEDNHRVGDIRNVASGVKIGFDASAVGGGDDCTTGELFDVRFLVRRDGGAGGLTEALVTLLSAFPPI